MQGHLKIGGEFAAGSTVRGKFNLERVVETGETFTIPDTHCYIVSRYLSVEGTGVVVLQGDATLHIT